LTLTAKSALLLLVVLLRLGLTGRTDNWVKVNRKIEAASSFFLYTFFGSLLLFIALGHSLGLLLIYLADGIYTPR
jgi:NADH:ubiquinone oxidoreductase subunit 4 (subunit M)